MLYDYLLTMFKVIVGLITTERMIYFAIGSVVLYFVWMFISLATCFQKRFYRNSVKLYNFVRKTQLSPSNPEVLDKKISKISKGFYYGWRKFKAAEYGKPSEFITRREVLDVEINGGVLNQGKSFMKAYINFVSIFLFVFNLAYLSGHEGLSLYLLAESLVLPLVLFAILRVFYYLYTSIKQQLYKQDVECLYDVMLVLDEIYAKEEAPVYVQAPAETVSETETTEIVDEQLEEVPQEEQLEEAVAEPEDEEVVERKKRRTIDDYDIFKKKNIDVDKLLNEVPQSGTTLPYIDVDSDYVIKDDDTPISKSYADKQNGSDVLGGMMQDMSSIKKQMETQNFIDVDKEIATIDPELQEANKEKPEEQKEESVENEKTESSDEPIETSESENKEGSDDVFENLSAFEVSNNDDALNAVQEESVNTETIAEESKEETQESEVAEEDSVSQVESSKSEEKVIEINRTPTDEISEEKRENIANIVGGFKSNRSKLANGGVVIERNERPAKRDYSRYDQAETVDEGYAPVAGITKLETNEDTNVVLNSIKGSTSIYDNPSYDMPAYDPYGAVNPMYNQGYAQPNYNQGYGYNAGYVPPVNQPYMQPAQPYEQTSAYGNQYSNYQEPVQEYVEEYDEDVYEDEELEVVEEMPKTPKVKKTAEKAPAKKSTKSKEKAVVEEVKTPAKTRGRPKKQVFDETLTIKSDKEFDQVLSRAEKLMRKSDEGLSASQSKRIEKELKMLMDAMNRYKEGK